MAFDGLPTLLKSISVVIPNYNGRFLLQQNLPSVYEALADYDYEIIVADDASVDDSISYLQQNHADIKIVYNTINKGFSGNVNSGLAIATKELVFILNSDVQLTPSYFTYLIPHFDLPDCFGVMGQITSTDIAKIQDTAKYPAYSFANIHSNLNYYNKANPVCYTFFISGANALLNRQKLMQLGGFNELFNPYYYEDVDLGLTAWQAGYKLFYDHRAVCIHNTSETIKKEKSEKVKLVIKRNKFSLHYLHLDGIELGIFLFLLSLKTMGRLLILDQLYVKSYLNFIKTIPDLNLKKKLLKPFRIKSLKQVTHFIQGDIKHQCTNIKIVKSL